MLSFLAYTLGLLAGLWEFPCVSVDREEPLERRWEKIRRELFGGGGEVEHTHIGQVSKIIVMHSSYVICSLFSPRYYYCASSCSQVVHQFSHIHHHCHCWRVMVTEATPLLVEDSQTTKWIDKAVLTQQPISTLVRKASVAAVVMYVCGAVQHDQNNTVVPLFSLDISAFERPTLRRASSRERQ